MRSDKETFKLLGKNFKITYFENEEVDLNNIVDIKFRNIEDQLEEIPSYLQAFGVLQAKAMKKFKLAEMSYRVWRAGKERKVRERLEKEGIKFTEKVIEGKIRSSPAYMMYYKKIIESEEMYEKLKAIYWAISAKIEILKELNVQNSKLKKVNK